MFAFVLQVLHLVDFEQLKIENQQYFERIDGKNKELLQLKLSTGKTVQVRVVFTVKSADTCASTWLDCLQAPGTCSCMLHLQPPLCRATPVTGACCSRSSQNA